MYSCRVNCEKKLECEFSELVLQIDYFIDSHQKLTSLTPLRVKFALSINVRV